MPANPGQKVCAAFAVKRRSLFASRYARRGCPVPGQGYAVSQTPDRAGSDPVPTETEHASASRGEVSSSPVSFRGRQRGSRLAGLREVDLGSVQAGPQVIDHAPEHVGFSFGATSTFTDHTQFLAGLVQRLERRPTAGDLFEELGEQRRGRR